MRDPSAYIFAGDIGLPTFSTSTLYRRNTSRTKNRISREMMQPPVARMAVSEGVVVTVMALSIHRQLPRRKV